MSGYFLTGTTSSIQYTNERVNTEDFPLGVPVCKNVIDLRNCSETDAIADSQNIDNYFYFWDFNLSYVALGGCQYPDSLLQFYKNHIYPKYQNTYEADRILSLLKARTVKLKLGEKAPLFSCKDINGKKIDLENCMGKYVLINIWASWCGPCVAELTALREIRRRYSEEKLVMVGDSFDENMDELKKSIKKYRLNWNHVYFDKILSALYCSKNIHGLPQLFLIDTKGILVYDKYANEGDGRTLPKLKYILEAGIGKPVK